MRIGHLTWALLAVIAVVFVAAPERLTATESFNLIGWLKGTGVDVHPHTCDECGGVHDGDGPCIERYPVEICVVGKKEVFDSKIKYEYVSIPETRYHWKKTHITKEIPCPYCKPVCKSEDCQKCVGEEKWEKECLECGELHCKHIEHKIEKVENKYCDHEPGETTIKVKYRSCVKVPYTVYRQVKKPVCVKQPRYEKVDVPITKHVCKHCSGGGCSECGQ